MSHSAFYKTGSISNEILNTSRQNLQNSSFTEGFIRQGIKRTNNYHTRSKSTRKTYQGPSSFKRSDSVNEQSLSDSANGYDEMEVGRQEISPHK